MDVMVIGIAGGTGSGKTTLTRRLVERFGADVSVLNHDNYYKAHDDMPFEARRRLNYDHPDSFDTDLLVRDLKQLRQGVAVDCPTYDYTVHNRAQATLRVEPARVVIVEGILIFENQALREQMDIKIFVDTDADVRILRRLVRDVKERGRSLDSVVGQYLSTVKPMHEAFVEPSKKYADLIVPEGGNNQVALEMIVRRVQHHLDGR